MVDFNKLDKDLSAHEQASVERWNETIDRIKRIEYIVIGSAGFIIALLLHLVME